MRTNNDDRIVKGISFNSFNNQNLFLNKKLSKSSTKISEFYSPIAICLWSLHNNAESFKGILMEIYNIAYKISENFNGFSQEKVNNYRFVELINYCIFICGIASPPHYSRMKLNFSNIKLNR